jgi:hypothetical protein
MDNNPIPVTPINSQRVNPLDLDVNRLSSSNLVRDLAAQAADRSLTPIESRILS